MKKVIILLLVTVMLPATVSAQSITYVYDAAGNRISRSLATKNQAPRKALTDYDTSEMTILSISVGPNPTNGLLNIRLSQWDDAYSCHLLLSDLSGRIVIEQNMDSPVATLNLSSYSNGYYLLLVEVNGEQQFYKIIKN